MLSICFMWVVPILALKLFDMFHWIFKTVGAMITIDEIPQKEYV
jgi:hypothetical protein